MSDVKLDPRELVRFDATMEVSDPSMQFGEYGTLGAGFAWGITVHEKLHKAEFDEILAIHGGANTGVEAFPVGGAVSPRIAGLISAKSTAIRWGVGIAMFLDDNGGTINPDKNTASILKYFAAGNRYGEDGRMLRLMSQLPSQEHGVIVEVLIDDIRQLPSDPAAVPSWAGAMNLDGDDPLINEALASTRDVGKLPLIPCRWMVLSKARMLEFLPLLSRDDGSSVPAEMLALESNVLEHHALCHMLGLSARSLTDAYLDAFVAANPAQHLDPRVHLAGGRKADATAVREPGFFPGFLAPWGRSGFPKGKVPCAVPTCFRSGDNVCAKCKEIAYCSRECQMANWKQHKRTCEKRSSGEGGGGGPTGPSVVAKFGPPAPGMNFSTTINLRSGTTSGPRPDAKASTKPFLMKVQVPTAGVGPMLCYNHDRSVHGQISVASAPNVAKAVRTSKLSMRGMKAFFWAVSEGGGEVRIFENPVPLQDW